MQHGGGAQGFQQVQRFVVDAGEYKLLQIGAKFDPTAEICDNKADDDGNIWVRTIPTKPTPGGAVYDVVNAKGEVVDRVQIPENRTIVGFGPGGVVILAARDGMMTKLERARVK